MNQKDDKLRIRAQILMLFRDKNGLTYQEVSRAIGAKSLGIANYYIKDLESDGLVIRERIKAGIRLTDLGAKVAGMLHVTQEGDLVIHKILPGLTRERFVDFREAALRLDEAYSKSSVNGIMKNSKEFVRKVTGAQIYQAIRTSSTYQEAADKLSIDRKSLDTRIKNIVNEMEKAENSSTSPLTI